MADASPSPEKEAAGAPPPLCFGPASDADSNSDAGPALLGGGDSPAASSDAGSLFGDEAPLSAAAGPSDPMEKCLRIVERALMAHWHVYDSGRFTPLGRLTLGSGVVHVFDDEDWVNDLYELGEHHVVYSNWLLKFDLAEGALRANPQLAQVVREGLGQDFGGDLDCLAQGALCPGRGVLRVRVAAGKYRGALSVLDSLLRSLSLHLLGLPGSLPAALPREVSARVRALLLSRPAVRFDGAAPDCTEGDMEGLFAEAGAVVRVRLLRPLGQFGGRGECEFRSAADAARAACVLDGRKVGSGLLQVWRRF